MFFGKQVNPAKGDNFMMIKKLIFYKSANQYVILINKSI